MEISDIAGLKEPLSKLIEVSAKGIGNIAEPWLTKRKADAKAYEIKKIGEALNDPAVQGNIVISNGELSIELLKNSIEERALSTIIHQGLKRQENTEKILDKAQENLICLESVTSEDLDEDWITRFFSTAQDVSNEDMQTIWAKILSDEIIKPKSYSLRTLELLKNISSDEARIIANFAQLSLDAGEAKFVYRDRDLLFEHGISFKDIRLLQELNIIESDLSYTIEPNSTVPATSKDKVLIIKNNSNTEIIFPIHNFTNIGCEISNLIENNFNIAYAKDISRELKGLGTVASDIEVSYSDLYYHNKNEVGFSKNVTVI